MGVARGEGGVVTWGIGWAQGIWLRSHFPFFLIFLYPRSVENRRNVSLLLRILYLLINSFIWLYSNSSHYVSIYLFICLLIHKSIYLFIYLFIYKVFVILFILHFHLVFDISSVRRMINIVNKSGNNSPVHWIPWIQSYLRGFVGWLNPAHWFPSILFIDSWWLNLILGSLFLEFPPVIHVSRSLILMD